MEFLFKELPNLPWPLITIMVNTVGILGTILLSYGLFLEVERRRDGVFCVGACCLLVYALWVGNKIFTLSMSLFAIVSFVNFIEITSGRHKHSAKMVEEYKHPNQ